MTTTASIYYGIREHMDELFNSAESVHFAEHSAAYGEQESFLAANIKMMIIGAVLGAIIACVLWFISALGPEFHRNLEQGVGKEAMRG